jgi:hypothetical protein
MAGLHLAVLVAACASPTLPLPPPEAPSQTTGVDADHITLKAACGGAQGGALIIVINDYAPADIQVGGAYADNCGAWQASIYAHSGDTLRISQEANGLSSPDTTVTVR